MIIPHNLTNKFQPLDLPVSKAAKAFIENRYNDWDSDEVVRQLKSDNDLTDIKSINQPINQNLFIYINTYNQ